MLFPDEEKVIQDILGDGRKSLSMGIAEFAVSQEMGKNPISQWNSIVKPGVVCFVYDEIRNGHYIQVVDMNKSLRAWEQRIEKTMGFQRKERWIVTFDSAYGKACINFADVKEADHFANTLDTFISSPAKLSKKNNAARLKTIRPSHSLPDLAPKSKFNMNKSTDSQFNGTNTKSTKNSSKSSTEKLGRADAGILQKTLVDGSVSYPAWADSTKPESVNSSSEISQKIINKHRSENLSYRRPKPKQTREEHLYVNNSTDNKLLFDKRREHRYTVNKEVKSHLNRSNTLSDVDQCLGSFPRHPCTSELGLRESSLQNYRTRARGSKAETEKIGNSSYNDDRDYCLSIGIPSHLLTKSAPNSPKLVRRDMKPIEVSTKKLRKSTSTSNLMSPVLNTDPSRLSPHLSLPRNIKQDGPERFNKSYNSMNGNTDLQKLSRNESMKYCLSEDNYLLPPRSVPDSFSASTQIFRKNVRGRKNITRNPKHNTNLADVEPTPKTLSNTQPYSCYDTNMLQNETECYEKRTNKTTDDIDAYNLSDDNNVIKNSKSVGILSPFMPSSSSASTSQSLENKIRSGETKSDPLYEINPRSNPDNPHEGKYNLLHSIRNAGNILKPASILKAKTGKNPKNKDRLEDSLCDAITKIKKDNCIYDDVNLTDECYREWD